LKNIGLFFSLFSFFIFISTKPTEEKKMPIPSNELRKKFVKRFFFDLMTHSNTLELFDLILYAKCRLNEALICLKSSHFSCSEKRLWCVNDKYWWDRNDISTSGSIDIVRNIKYLFLILLRSLPWSVDDN
jgi:hypothetical protein